MKRLLLFGMGSTIGAAIDFCIALVLLRIGCPGWLALALAMCVSASVVYHIHQRVTFADIDLGELSLRRLTLFLLSTFFVYGLRMLVFEGLRYSGGGEVLALSVALVSSLVVSFGVSRYYIFQSGRAK